jgi:preprotein translocase subunit SecE
MDKVKAIIAKVKQFLREVRAELRKVTWPTWKGTLASTSVVLVVVVIVSIFLGLVDLGLTNVIKLILG